MIVSFGVLYTGVLAFGAGVGIGMWIGFWLARADRT